MAKPRLVPVNNLNTAIKVRYDSDYQEYQVWVNDCPDYYTDCKDDAIATAKIMSDNY